MWQDIALNGAPWSTLAFVVLSVIRGWLIPRSLHLDRVSDLKVAIAALEETVAEKDRQIAILLGRPTS